MNSLNSADIRTMIKSLYYAIQWHESIIDSYKFELHFVDGVPERRVPLLQWKMEGINRGF
jgi:hypothetical protein